MHPFQYAHERSRLLYMANPKSMPIMSSLLRSGAFFPTPIAEVERFSVNGPLPVPGSPQPIFTPGHTLGHCSLALPERDAVILGDAIVTLDPYTGQTGPRIVAGAATADSFRNLRALDRIAETGAKHLLPGHGEVWSGGAEAAVAKAREVGAN